MRLLGTFALLAGTTAGTVAVVTSAASTRAPLSVTVTASPASGGTVLPGATVTYRLDATSRRPLPAGATVVDDLSGLLGHAAGDPAAACTSGAPSAGGRLTVNADDGSTR